MAIKGLFNHSEKNDDIDILKEKIERLEEKIKKINTLEVQIKRFIKLEPELQKQIYSIKQMDKKTPQSKADHVPRQNQVDNQRSIQTLENKIFSKMKEYIDQELVPLKTQINHLENLFNRMEENYESLQSSTQQLSQAMHILENRPPDPPQRPENDQQIVIQKVNIEKILLDKYEQTNNFGQLGIKDISGQLNIGATYGKGVIPAELVENLMENINEIKNMDNVHTTDESSSESVDESSEEESKDYGNFEDIPID
ncbi:hypothetical protein [Heyndrickxia oleronia]|uniref:hypothetical protein n=1 Tax=Heyndrickxia oleronia TaxID=38875 RepID=UPI001C0EF5BF|nr:hypothetical protein [Heyndrickxia oleronia]MBU5212778.1 hypothetical protein [Heyndrickxia oleronia]